MLQSTSNFYLLLIECTILVELINVKPFFCGVMKCIKQNIHCLKMRHHTYLLKTFLGE